MKKIFGTIALLSTLIVSVQAQKGWKWPEDSATKAIAEEKNVLQSDAVKMGNFKNAKPALVWLITNAPNLNKSLYINGAKIFDNLAQNNKVEARKLALADSLLLMYDLRIKHFGRKPFVLNRKVGKAYKYFAKDYSKSEWLLEMFDEAIDIGGDAIPDGNFIAYMNVIKVNAKLKKINEDDILNRYDKLTEVIEAKLAKNKSTGKNNDSLEKKKSIVDNILTEIVDINCEFVELNMGPKFEADPKDIKLVKRMFQFMLTGKCTDSPLFLSVAKQLQIMQPDFGLAKVIGTKSLANKDYSAALKYYNQAIELTEDGESKSEVYVQMGKVYSIRQNKSQARSMFKRAIEGNPANREAYSSIGDLYYNSYNDCKEDQDMVKDRLVFIAAYNMYKKAGKTAKLNSTKEQFPSKEELFNGDYRAGESLNIGCWINESVVLQTRD